MATDPREPLPLLSCACASLRRAARAVTRLYDQELRATGLEPTQFTLLMALSAAGEMTQGMLGELLVLDTTTLSRSLRPLLNRGLIRARRGEDRRERFLSLTAAGRQKFNRSHVHWEKAQRRLQGTLRPATWNQLRKVLAEVARAAL